MATPENKAVSLAKVSKEKKNYLRLLEQLEFAVRMKVDTAPALKALDDSRR